MPKRSSAGPEISRPIGLVATRNRCRCFRPSHRLPDGDAVGEADRRGLASTGWIRSRVGSATAFAALDCLNLDNSLAVGCLELAHDLPDGGQHRSDRQGETVEASPSVLTISDVMHSGVSDAMPLSLV